MDALFDIISPIREIEVIAAGKSVRSRRQLARDYGPGRWRK